MERHNAAKLVPLTSQTKLTLTLLNPNIYVHFVDTH